MGRVLRAIGRFIWRFMVIFSFIVNIVLVVVVAFLLVTLFDIKNNIAGPLVQGLHSSFVGLKSATIDWTIPVRDTIPVTLDIPLETETVVVLTEAVPINVTAYIDILSQPAQVSLNLPAGLELPVRLDLDVGVDQPLDVALDVRAVIPLKDTQLNDPVTNLQLLLEPIAVALDNLPNDYGEAFAMVGDALGGNAPDLLAENDYSRNPWPGYATTAGLNYPLANVPFPNANLPCQTGIVPLGGIPALDEQLIWRQEVWAAGGPDAVNEAARQQLDAQAIPDAFYGGGFSAFRAQAVAQGVVAGQVPCNQPMTSQAAPGGGQAEGALPTDSTPTPAPDGAIITQPLDPNDQGILPTPTPAP
jgi:hypothetical protein